MSERRDRMKVASDALLDCPDCGGQGWVGGTGMAHHPSCDGSCRNCPIPVQTQEPCETCGGSGQIRRLTIQTLSGPLARSNNDDGNTAGRG